MSEMDTSQTPQQSEGESLEDLAKRRQSMAMLMGAEGKFVAKGAHIGQAIAVFTSGGDAQGKELLPIYLNTCINIHVVLT